MNTFPTLGVPPAYPLDPDGETEDAVIRSTLEGGYEQTRPRFTRIRRSFGLNYELSDADVGVLKGFEIVTLVNGADSFDWVHPLTNEAYTVRLTAPIKYSKVDYGSSKVTLTVREV